MHALNTRSFAAALCGLLLTCACSAPERDPLPLTVGVHEIQLIVPPEWQRFDHGREQRFEIEMLRISLADMGPATREGFHREIAHARELYRLGQLEDARALLNTLQLRPAFPSEQRWTSFALAWNKIRRAGLGRVPLEPSAVESAYTEVLVEVDALPKPDIASLAIAVLERIGHDQRRDVAEQRAMAVDGRGALLIDTWDRLNHTGRFRHVFVLNEGNLLLARMEMGRFEDMEPAFDDLVASLSFRPSPYSASPGS
jgi:hypothetical protein